jgi:hypothetical protein
LCPRDFFPKPHTCTTICSWGILWQSNLRCYRVVYKV